jgi:hypothetical protein
MCYPTPVMLRVPQPHPEHKRSGRWGRAISERPTPLPRALFAKPDLCIPVTPSSSTGDCKLSAAGCFFPYFRYTFPSISFLFCRFPNSYRKNRGVGGPLNFQFSTGHPIKDAHPERAARAEGPLSILSPDMTNRSISEFLPHRKDGPYARRKGPGADPPRGGVGHYKFNRKAPASECGPYKGIRSKSARTREVGTRRAHRSEGSQRMRATPARLLWMRFAFFNLLPIEMP